MRNSEFLEHLTNIVRTLSMLRALCDDVPILKEDIGFPVKGKGNILDIIYYQNITVFLFLPKRKEILDDVHKSMKEWINYFKQSYRIKSNSRSKKPYLLTKVDAKKLSNDVNFWITQIINHYSQPSTILIKEHDFNRFFLAKLRKGLGRGITSDLREGFELIGFNSPTAASMILLRATEGIIKQYYKKLTGKNTKKKLNDLLIDLEQNHKLKKPLLGYLHYLRDKRNAAMHSGKIFKQEESERILINVKGLLEEIK